MDVLGVLSRLRAHRLLVTLALLIAAGVALSSKYSVTNGFASKATATGAADAQLLVDTRRSALGSIVASTTDAEINLRAPLYAEYAASEAVLPMVAAAAQIPRADLSITANTSEVSSFGAGGQSASYNNAPVTSSTPYHVTLTASNQLPIIDVSTQAPSSAAAVSLAQATVTAMRAAVRSLTASQKIPAAAALDLRLLGPPTGGIILSGPSTSKAVVYGVGTLVVLLLLLLAGDSWLLSRQRRSHGAHAAPHLAAATTGGEAGAGMPSLGSAGDTHERVAGELLGERSGGRAGDSETSAARAPSDDAYP